MTYALIAVLASVIGYLIGAREHRRESTWHLAMEISDALDDYELTHAMPPVDDAVATTRALYVARAITGADPTDLSRLDLADGLTHPAPTEEIP